VDHARDSRAFLFVLLNAPETAVEFFRELDAERVFVAAKVTDAIQHGCVLTTKAEP
jgi:uncharacterized protein with HEPN domain